MTDRHKRFHETAQHDRIERQETGFRYPNLTAVQQIEGGGPMKRIPLQDMP